LKTRYKLVEKEMMKMISEKEMMVNNHNETLRLERMSYILSFETLLTAYKSRLATAIKEIDIDQLNKSICICERVLKEMKE
jgi:hypothetical protein